MTDSVIDEHYEAARKAGAIGGKLMGAGGGGFFMFYTRPQRQAPRHRSDGRARAAPAPVPLRYRRRAHRRQPAPLVSARWRAETQKPDSSLALLDRDGTLIDVVRDEETGTITTAFHPSQIRLLDGVVDGLRLLVGRGLRAGHRDQPARARQGTLSRAKR